MKQNIIFLFFMLSSLLSLAHKKNTVKDVTIKGFVTETSDYCGGAMPSEAKLEMLRTPHGLGQKTIYIKIGSVNKESAPVIKKVVTDESGNFTVVLKCGTTYSFVEEWKSKAFELPKKTEYVVWDTQCLKERYQKADFVLKVKKSNNPLVNINYHNPCFFKPFCGEYSGPLPP